MEQKQVVVRDEGFSDWLVAQGYCDEDGVLTVELREASALYIQTCIHEDKVEIERRFVRIAKNLWTFYSQGYWDELGYANFSEFLRSPEIDLAPSIGYSLKDIGMYLEQGLFSEERVLEIGPSKMRTLLPAIKENPDDIDEWLDRATELNNLDLMDAVSGKEIVRYSGTGPLMSLIEELHEKPIFWTGEVQLRIQTT